jgi:hypothetical protein
LKDAFDKVKTTLASIARQFKAKLRALTEQKHTDPGGSTFIAKLKSGATIAAKEVENALTKFAAAAKAITSRAKEIIVKVSSIVEKIIVDAGKITIDATKELFQAVKTISEKGISDAKALIDGVESKFHMNGSTNYTHGMTMTVEASIALFDPVLVGSFIVGAGIIAAANSYEP